VRARLIDKGDAPRWRPPTLAEVSGACVEDLFRPDEPLETYLPTRQEMQAARV
jgi:hypothetical protein